MIVIPVTIDGIKKDIKCEIQIRTSAMDFWTSNEHSLNYKKEGLSDKDKLELKRISDELWNIDIMMNAMAKKNQKEANLTLATVHKDIDAEKIKNYVKWRKQSEI